eukprot:3662581-Lingulodinium_polyedra.AAC.1
MENVLHAGAEHADGDRQSDLMKIAQTTNAQLGDLYDITFLSEHCRAISGCPPCPRAADPTPGARKNVAATLGLD